MNKSSLKPALSIFMAFLLLFSPVFSRTIYNSHENPIRKIVLTASPHVDYKIHDNGKFGLTVVNTGVIGSGMALSMVANNPSFRYPYPGPNEYLFGGTIWVGAINGTDTLVSVGADGWAYNHEIWPDSFPDGAIIDSSDENMQKYIATFTDTTFVPPDIYYDPYDARAHIPINVEITRTSYSWPYDYAEDFAILDYSVKNIGQDALTEIYIGYYIDGDVKIANSQTGFDDDIAGFRQTVLQDYGPCQFEDTVNIAWIADADGKDDMMPAGGCDFKAVTGMKVLRTPSDSLRYSFNWWVSNGNASLDWGPRLAGTAEDPFRDFGGFLGTPAGDRNKYYIMRHQEFDYDQLFTAVDHTVEGWLPPPVFAANLADGIDTKYLLSFGPFNLEPGESLPFTLAYIAGDNFHTEPCDAFVNLFNSSDPQAYYDALNFDDLANNARWAGWVYDNPGVDTDSDGYAGKFHLCDNDTFWYEGDGVPDFNPGGIPTDAPETPSGLIPESYVLNQNYPNPFNPQTVIKFTLPRRSEVRIEIFNILGEKIKTILDKSLSAGNHQAIWDGTDASGRQCASGVYFYSLSTPAFCESRKMVLMR